MMRGAGEDVSLALGIEPLPAVLINPGVPVPTAPVFKALGLSVGQTLSGGEHPFIPADADAETVLATIGPARNDLEGPALTVAPVIGECLSALRGQGSLLARMSGSGATVFGLFEDRRAAVRAAKRLRAAHPGWWIAPTFLR